jgi:hypothetical protein
MLSGGKFPISNPIKFPNPVVVTPRIGVSKEVLYPCQFAGSDHPDGKEVGTN